MLLTIFESLVWNTLLKCRSAKTAREPAGPGLARCISVPTSPKQRCDVCLNVAVTKVPLEDGVEDQ